jgi:hypothetical protein
MPKQTGQPTGGATWAQACKLPVALLLTALTTLCRTHMCKAYQDVVSDCQFLQLVVAIYRGDEIIGRHNKVVPGVRRHVFRVKIGVVRHGGEEVASRGRPPRLRLPSHHDGELSRPLELWQGWVCLLSVADILQACVTEGGHNIVYSVHSIPSKSRRALRTLGSRSSQMAVTRPVCVPSTHHRVSIAAGKETAVQSGASPSVYTSQHLSVCVQSTEQQVLASGSPVQA